MIYLDQMLNLLNNIPEEDADYLYGKGETPEETRLAAENRSMDLYISQNGNLTAIGFIDGNLVWLSITRINDLFLTRRVFDCMKVGGFYRKVSFDTALTALSVTTKDLENMCHVNIQHLEHAHPVFSGCLVNQTKRDGDDALTGTEFAKILAVLPMRLRSLIPQIGAEDDILAELEKDYAALEALYPSNDAAYNPEKHDMAVAICSKWQSAECLKLSDRARIRTLYHDICYHRHVIA